MYIKMLLRILCVIATAFCLITPLHAVDLGLQVNCTLGSGTAEPYDDYYDYDSVDYSTTTIGLGLVFNSSLGSETINNRFLLMLEFGSMETDDWDMESDVTLLSVYDSLGFVISKSDNRLIWLGPQIGLRYYTVSDDEDMTGFGVTLGAALGVNFISEKSSVFGLEIGVRYISANFESSESGNSGADIYGPEGFVGATLLF